MFREDVAAHYRSRGYRVREDARVRDPTGDIHACDLVVQGPLGNLIVAWDEGDGLELASLRRKAKALGATPILAAESLQPQVRQAALRHGVVVVDRDELQRPTPTEPPAPPPAVPWPAVRGPERPEGPLPPWPSHGARPRVQDDGPKVARDVDEILGDLPKAVAPPQQRTGDAPFWKRRLGAAVAPTPPAPLGDAVAGAPSVAAPDLAGPDVATVAAAAMPVASVAAPAPTARPRFAWLRPSLAPQVAPSGASGAQDPDMPLPPPPEDLGPLPRARRQTGGPTGTQPGAQTLMAPPPDPAVWHAGTQARPPRPSARGSAPATSDALATPMTPGAHAQRRRTPPTMGWTGQQVARLAVAGAVAGLVVFGLAWLLM